MPRVEDLRVKLFADGADLPGMIDMAANPLIKGFTTNPTLMRKAGVKDYESFAREVLEAIQDRPVSFEVLSDDFDEMERQARKIASWGRNVYVKVPVTNTKGEFAGSLIERLSRDGVVLNVTALLTKEQVWKVMERLSPETPAAVSVFAGRIADTGSDPISTMAAAVMMATHMRPKVEIIWASPRQLLDVFKAEEVGCHIITATTDVLKKLSLVGRNLTDYSVDTVKMFFDDAQAAGFTL